MASEREDCRVDSTALEEEDVSQLLGGLGCGTIRIPPPTSGLTYGLVTSLFLQDQPRHKGPSLTPKPVLHLVSGRFRQIHKGLRKTPVMEGQQ